MHQNLQAEKADAALLSLRDPALLKSLSYIGGRWTANAGNRTFEVSDPATGAALARR